MSADPSIPSGQRHPNSLANLQINKQPPWEPGKSANPGGVAKGTQYVSEVYKRLISLPIEELRAFEPKTGAEAAALKQALNAVDGKALKALPSLREITDRTEGKAPQKIELSGELTVSTDLVLAFHAQIQAMIVNASNPQEIAEQITQALMLPAEEFARAISEPDSL